MCEQQKSLAGKFIVLDGPDGCGKSTQVRLLCAWLERQGAGVVSFRDPGNTDIGERIRQILLSPEHARMGTMTELLLYMAARAQLWTEHIAPALAQGRAVVLDRWLSSTCAYQGVAGGFGAERVIRIAGDCLERVWPDITVILDVDRKTAITRMKRAWDRMERKGDDYHRKVRQGFLSLAQGRDDFTVIDTAGSIEEVHGRIVECISSKFGVQSAES